MTTCAMQSLTSKSRVMFSPHARYTPVHPFIISCVCVVVADLISKVQSRESANRPSRCTAGYYGMNWEPTPFKVKVKCICGALNHSDVLKVKKKNVLIKLRMVLCLGELGHGCPPGRLWKLAFEPRAFLLVKLH